MTKYLPVILIVLFCQSCTPVSQHPAKPPPPPQIAKKVAAVKPLKKPVKQISMTMIEEHLKKSEWIKARQLFDEWQVKNPEVKKEIESHIGLVKRFLVTYNNCERKEAESSKSRKEVVACYVKLIKHNWNKLPQRSYFSPEFTVHLTALADGVKKKMKRLRLAEDIEFIQDDVSRKMLLGKEIRKRKKRTANEFFDAYNNCLELEKTSPTDVYLILTCYRDVYLIRNRVFLKKEVSDDVFVKGKELEKKLDFYHRKYDILKGKTKKKPAKQP